MTRVRAHRTFAESVDGSMKVIGERPFLRGASERYSLKGWMNHNLREVGFDRQRVRRGQQADVADLQVVEWEGEEAFL
jgi:hypothetical protein